MANPREVPLPQNNNNNNNVKITSQQLTTTMNNLNHSDVVSRPTQQGYGHLAGRLHMSAKELHNFVFSTAKQQKRHEELEKAMDEVKELHKKAQEEFKQASTDIQVDTEVVKSVAAMESKIDRVNVAVPEWGRMTAKWKTRSEKSRRLKVDSREVVTQTGLHFMDSNEEELGQNLTVGLQNIDSSAPDLIGVIYATGFDSSKWTCTGFTGVKPTFPEATQFLQKVNLHKSLVYALYQARKYWIKLYRRQSNLSNESSVSQVSSPSSPIEGDEGSSSSNNIDNIVHAFGKSMILFEDEV